MHLLRKCGPLHLKHGPGFDFIDHWCFWGIEISSGVNLGSFISSTNGTDIAEAVFHGVPVGNLVSHYHVCQFIRI